MKTFTIAIGTLLFVGLSSSFAQVQFNNSGDGNPIGQISVTPGVGELNDANLVNIYSYGSVIFINTESLSATAKNIAVFNAAGQMIYEELNSNDSNTQIELGKDVMRGIYVVRLQAGDKTYSRKVFVR